VRPPTTALALLGALCATVALNGCSSSVQPGGKIADSSSGVTTPSPTAASSSPSAASGNSLPADLTLDFTAPQLTGESEDIYTSAKAFANAYEAAASAGKTTNTALTSMTSVYGAAGVMQTVDGDDHSGTRWAGTITFSHFEVGILPKATGIGFCESDTEAYPVTISGDTRKGGAPTGAAAVRAWELTVAKQPNGGYQVTAFETDPGDPVCM
jgi:hypothetical protein